MLLTIIIVFACVRGPDILQIFNTRCFNNTRINYLFFKNSLLTSLMISLLFRIMTGFISILHFCMPHHSSLKGLTCLLWEVMLEHLTICPCGHAQQQVLELRLLLKGYQLMLALQHLTPEEKDCTLFLAPNLLES